MRLRDQYRGSLPVDLPQRLYNGGVKVTAGASLDLGQCVFDAPGRPVRTVVGERIEKIGDGDDACLEGNALPRHPIRITGSIPPFVVAARDAMGKPHQLGPS